MFKLKIKLNTGNNYIKASKKLPLGNSSNLFLKFIDWIEF